MARYHFITELGIECPRERVWPLLAEPTSWPDFWRWVRSVDVVEPGGADRIGARYRLHFRTALPYTFTFETETVRVDRPSLIETRASGELAGSGLWQLSAYDAMTVVRYTWIVTTGKTWMNLAAPLARPAFSWNHEVLMRDFAEGLARHLDTRLVSLVSATVKPHAPGFGRLPAVPPMPAGTPVASGRP